MAIKHATMRDRLERLRTDETGMSFVFLSMTLMSFLAATMLAIDVGMFMNARTEAQRAADAGALAGATALVFDDFDDHSDGGPAVTSAISTAQANGVAHGTPSVLPIDVQFPMNPVTGRQDLVEVTVHRTAARANAIPTLIGQIFGHESGNITATATATAAPAGGAMCVLPFTIPDRWIEKQTGPWTPDDTFDMYEEKGNKQNSGAPLADPDIYIPPGTKEATGYDPERDKGLTIVLKNNNGGKVAPSFYNPWDLPGSVGGDDYRENISGCNPHLVELGNPMEPENGNMVGPTKQGGDDLINQDPGAHWDDDCNCVMGSDPKFKGRSPRVRIAPLYDPSLYASGQQTGKSQPDLKVVNYLGFFIEEVTGGGEITGRITPITGLVVAGSPTPVGAFAQAIMLVK